MADDQIVAIVADLTEYTRQEIIALTLNIDAELREEPPGGTPVKTGWARANWVPSVGQPYEADATKRDPTQADVSTQEGVASQGTNSVLTWKPEDGALFVSNNVPYMRRLNNGWSQQSPAGFVQAAIEKAIRTTYSVAASKRARLARADTFRAANNKPVRRTGK